MTASLGGMAASGSTPPALRSSTAVLAAAANASAWADVVLLVVGLGVPIEAEGRDRYTLSLPPAQQDLAAVVAASVRPGATLIVVVCAAGATDPLVPRADAIFYAGYAGEESGHGVFPLPPPPPHTHTHTFTTTVTTT